MGNRTVKERFESFFQKEDNGCWLWTGYIGVKGQAHFSVKRKKVLASRVSYEIYHKKEIGNLLVLHKCDNPMCVNPDHLFLGTQKDNMEDCKAKGRLAMSKIKHCPKNHPYNEQNTCMYFYKKTGSYYRRCRACARIRAASLKKKLRSTERNL